MAPSTSPDPLALDPETMRRMGYQVVDLLVERIRSLASGPVIQTADRAEMASRIDEPAPEEARDFTLILERLDRDVLPYVGHFDHPRFFGYIPGAGTWPGALGDLIAAATNIDSGAWREAAGPSQLELTVLEWFRDWIGYPADAAGVLVSGGSAANMTAVACAREALVGPMSDRIVAYTSDQTHSSVARAARHLGFRPDQVRVLPADESSQLRPPDVLAAMDIDATAGRMPFMVIANAGTTNTGAVDPIEELAEICRERGVWLHVDGAYGAFAVLTERGRDRLGGLALADSIALDPHKWLAMPFEVGCLMVRAGGLLGRAFELHPEYLRDRDVHADEVNFSDRGLQLTRAARAIKVWLSLQTFGVAAFRAAIDRAMDQAVVAQRRIEADDRLELVTPASFGIVTFRRRGAAGASPVEVDRHNASILAALSKAGDVMLTSTSIRGRLAIRLCVLNHGSDDTDVAYAIDRVASIEVSTSGRPPRALRAAREAGVDIAWLATRGFDPEHLRANPVFGSVTDEQASRFLSTAREERFEAGQHIIDRWALVRTFYLVVAGRLTVLVGDRVVRELAPGDHFGEIAAIDWGRDFSYGRTATVVAIEPVRLLSVPVAALRELMMQSPTIDHELRRIAAARLASR